MAGGESLEIVRAASRHDNGFLSGCLKDSKKSMGKQEVSKPQAKDK